MRGHAVTRIAGWDTHGLPVEIEVEKALQLSGKKDIEAYGVEAFNRLCRESVFTYKHEWEELSDRIGYWLDYAHPYVTCTPQYIESVWWLLRRLFDRELLVRGHRVLPYCPRCGTVLSSHELSLGYEEIRDKSIYVTFPLEDGSGRELVVWTTTPWTLPSNVAAAVHPDQEYGTYLLPDGRRVILATARAAAVLALGKDAPVPVPKATFPGSALIGLRYRRPLDVVPLPETAAHSVVVAGAFVTADEGSGIVHMAPAFGADDFAMGQTHGLALVRPVAADGTFQGTTWPELEGRLVTADETNELIIRELKRRGRHLRTEAHVHSYPHCWRCKSKLIYYARDSWFVRTSAVKDRLLALNRGITWHPPEVGSGPFRGLAREQRRLGAVARPVLGHAAPVWVSRPGSRSVVEVIGSFAELAARVGRPLPAGFDPHKPFIDALHLARAGRRDDAPGARGDRHLVRLRLDAVRPVALSVRARGRVRAALPGRFHLRGGGSDPGLVLFAARDRRHGLRPGALSPRRGERAGPGRAGSEDVEEPGQRGGSMGRHREFGADTVRLYLLASSQVWLPKRVRPQRDPGRGRRLPQHPPAHLRVLRPLRPDRGGPLGGADRREPAPRPVDREPAGPVVRLTGLALAGLRRDGRGPGRHGLHRRRPLQLVRPAERARFWAPDGTRIRGRWPRSASAW